MQRIKMVEYADCNTQQKQLYNGQITAHGRITNMKKTLLNSPLSFKVLMEWYPLRDEVVKFLGDFGVNIFCHAISTRNNCLICSTFFRKILIDNGHNPDAPKLSQRDSLLIDYGYALVNTCQTISNTLFARLKAEFSEEQIVALTAFGGMMIATNLINNALEVPFDDYLQSYTRR